MARLSEILGGILKDVTQSRVTADLQSRELYEVYRTHPLLARMPIPRVTVREMTLKLRFAIAEHDDPDYDKLDLTEAARRWTEHLRATVLPRVYGQATSKGRPLPPSVVARLGETLSASAGTLGLAKALRGDVAAIVAASAKLVASTRSRAPTRDRRGLPSVAALRSMAAKEVQREAAAFVPLLRRELAAAVDPDLRILVRDADLADVDESRVQEITLTLASDDIQLIAPATETAGKEGAERAG